MITIPPPLEQNEFAPVVLVVDTSHSMSTIDKKEGAKTTRMQQVNAALSQLALDLQNPPLSNLALLNIISAGGNSPTDLGQSGSMGDTFGGTSFVRAAHYRPPQLLAAGQTPLKQAIAMGISNIQQVLDFVTESGYGSKVPSLIVLSDGHNNDPDSSFANSWESVLTPLNDLESRGRALRVALYTHGADTQAMRQIAPEAHYRVTSQIGEMLRLVTLSSFDQSEIDLTGAPFADGNTGMSHPLAPQYAKLDLMLQAMGG